MPSAATLSPSSAMTDRPPESPTTPPPRSGTVLALHQLRKLYTADGHEVAAVDKVSFTIQAGEFVTLQGPSGSGKSTLLFMVAALLAPDSGTVEVDGIDPYQLSSAKRSRFRAERIGMVFQDFRLLPYLDVRRNVLAPTLAGGGGTGAASRADVLIAQLGLTPRRHHLPKQLSAGEQQRTALARALLCSPSLLLADEPTGNLDEENSEQVLAQLRTFALAGGAVLAATHDPAVAAAADRRLLLRDGQLRTD